MPHSPWLKLRRRLGDSLRQCTQPVSSPTSSTGWHALKARRVSRTLRATRCAQTGAPRFCDRSKTCTLPASVTAANTVLLKGAQARSPTGAPRSKLSTGCSWVGNGRRGSRARKEGGAWLGPPLAEERKRHSLAEQTHCSHDKHSVGRRWAASHRNGSRHSGTPSASSPGASSMQVGGASHLTVTHLWQQRVPQLDLPICARRQEGAGVQAVPAHSIHRQAVAGAVGLQGRGGGK